MKRLLTGHVVLLILSMGSTIHSSPQSFTDLNALGERIVTTVQAQKSDWKYEAVSPIEGSADVILQQWTSDSRSVRIAIVSHGSRTAASKALGALKTNGEGRDDLEGLGERSVSWGKNTVSFKTLDFTVDVSAVDTREILDVTESSKHVGDERKLCREFARLVANAIKGKD